MLRYEADVVILRPSGYAVEVEIKVSAGDIKADALKAHRHNSNMFRELWFAVPADLSDHPSIPEMAGILSVTEDRGFLRVTAMRRGRCNRYAKQWTPQQRQKLLEVGVMRIWSLKRARLDAWNQLSVTRRTAAGVGDER